MGMQHDIEEPMQQYASKSVPQKQKLKRDFQHKARLNNGNNTESWIGKLEAIVQN